MSRKMSEDLFFLPEMASSMDSSSSLIRYPFICIDFIVVIAAFVANLLSLAAVMHSHTLLPGFRRFLLSLNAADLYMSLVNILALIYQLHNNTNTIVDQNQIIDSSLTNSPFFECTGHMLRILKMAGFITNLLSLCGMSADHFVGIIYPLRYHQLSSKILGRITIVAIWLFSFSIAFLDVGVKTVFHVAITAGTAKEVDKKLGALLRNGPLVSGSNREANSKDYSAVLFEAMFDDFDNPFENSNESNRSIDVNKEVNNLLLVIQNDENRRSQSSCEYLKVGKMWLEFGVLALTTVCFIFLIICYGMIFKNVTKVSKETRSFDGYRSRKLVVTTVIFLIAFSVCWLPFVVFEFTMYIIFEQIGAETFVQGGGSALYLMIGQVLTSLLMLYPLVDPLIYAARIRAVRHSGVLLLARLPCFIRLSCVERLLSQQALFTTSGSRKPTACGNDLDFMLLPTRCISQLDALSSSFDQSSGNRLMDSKLVQLNSNASTTNYSNNSNADLYNNFSRRIFPEQFEAM